jgi:hypothetical protein
LDDRGFGTHSLRRTKVAQLARPAPGRPDVDYDWQTPLCTCRCSISPLTSAGLPANSGAPQLPHLPVLASRAPGDPVHRSPGNAYHAIVAQVLVPFRVASFCGAQ